MICKYTIFQRNCTNKLIFTLPNKTILVATDYSKNTTLFPYFDKSNKVIRLWSVNCIFSY